MKRLIILLVLFTVVGVGTLQAQYDFKFGFEASPFISWMSTDKKPVKSDGTNLGFQIVMNGEYYIRDRYALKGGIGISFSNGGGLLHTNGGNIFRNSDLSQDSLPTFTSVQYKLQYVEIPLAFRMRTQEFGYIRYFAELPMFSIGINSQARADIDNISDGEDTDISRDTPFLNLSWGVGGGAEYALTSTTSLVAGIFYQQGIADVTKDSTDDQSKAVIKRLVLRLGVMF
ncbi:MAG: outer membrane beta-barrel protein [Saprospiraceae bacterium]|nr:outer membrane beta-barrel protein [Saprospiraceae bacterium]